MGGRFAGQGGPRVPGRFAVLGVVAVAGTALVARQVKRGFDVFHSVDTHAAYWKQRATEPGELLYVALGDSTAQGVGAANPEDGYVGRLARDLAVESGTSVQVVNLSVSGARVADLVREQLPEFRALVSERTPDLVTVSIGANDTGRTPRAEFIDAMREIVAALPAGSRIADVPYFRGARRGADARAFSGVIRDLVGGRRDLVLVDLHAATTGLRLREYADDLFHPSAVGYDRYYAAFTEVPDRLASSRPTSTHRSSSRSGS